MSESEKEIDAAYMIFFLVWTREPWTHAMPFAVTDHSIQVLRRATGDYVFFSFGAGALIICTNFTSQSCEFCWAAC